MAITAGNTTHGGNVGAGTTTLTFAHNNNGDCVVVGMHFSGDSGSTNSSMAVTYDGVSLTEIGSPMSVGNIISLWFLKDASAHQGSHNVVVTVLENAFGVFTGSAASYSGTDKTTNPTANSTAGPTGSLTTITGTVNVTVDQSWPVAYGPTSNGVGESTAGTGTTRRVTSGAANQLGIFDSNGGLGTGNQNLVMNHAGASSTMGMIIMALAPAAGSASNSNFLMFMPN